MISFTFERVHGPAAADDRQGVGIVELLVLIVVVADVAGRLAAMILASAAAARKTHRGRAYARFGAL